jgi:hypothetical protein
MTGLSSITCGGMFKVRWYRAVAAMNIRKFVYLPQFVSMMGNISLVIGVVHDVECLLGIFGPDKPALRCQQRQRFDA